MLVNDITLKTPAVDCRQCAMAEGDSPRYRPDLKCCTYYPWIPNYLVGEAFLIESSAQSTLRELVRLKQFVTPLGVLPPPAYRESFRRLGGFGQNYNLLCPFFAEGRCMIWSQRSSECASYWCEKAYSTQDLKDWADYGEKLHRQEMALAQNAMLEKGFLWPEVEHQLRLFELEQGPWQMEEGEWSQCWQHWQGREETYFKECAEAVRLHKVGWLKEMVQESLSLPIRALPNVLSRGLHDE